MESYDLTFGRMIILNDNLIEVIINEGIEMNVEIVDQYHNFLLSNLRAPFKVLINKVNRYTYDFEAQCKLATLKEISAIAIVTYTHMARVSTESIMAMPRDIEWNAKLFTSRDEALEWLL